MKISIKIWQIGWVLLLPCALIAQTANTGELTMLPNTQFSTVGDFNNTGTFINDGEAFIYAHFTNNGTVDFASGGLTRFQGEAVQQLAGVNISYFYNVLFDNVSSPTSAFEVSGDMSIANEADFNNGIVNNDDFGGAIIFEDNATHSQVFDGSHVDGPVQKIGDDSFEFPIGDKQFFRYAAISAPDNTSDTFSGKYFFENPVGQTINGETPTANTAGVLTLLDTAEFWTINRSSGNSDVLLTLSWEEGTTTPGAIAANPQSAIHIARWNDAQQIWVDEGGVVDAANKTVTTPIRLEDYGIFTLARVNEGLIIPEGNLVIYNGITPNGDGKNDYFFIDDITKLANNNVKVFNRWGVKVFETNDYDTSGNVFKGESQGRLTVNDSELLPTGTYFYVIEFDYDNGGRTDRYKKAGYLYLTTE